MIGACKTFLSHCRIDYLIIILSIRAFSNPSLLRRWIRSLRVEFWVLCRDANFARDSYRPTSVTGSEVLENDDSGTG